MAFFKNETIEPLPPKGNALVPKLSQSGDPLIFVDMPEVLLPETYPGGMKASYRDIATGAFRMMYYHQNKSGKTLFYCIAFSNTGDEPVRVNWGRIGIGEHIDAALLGRDTTYDWFGGSDYRYWGTIPPHRTKYFTIRQVRNYETGSAIIDFELSAPLTVTMLICDAYPQNDPAAGLPNDEVLNAPVLPWQDILKIDGSLRVVGITRGKWACGTLRGSITYSGLFGNAYLYLGNDPRQGKSTLWHPNECLSGYSAVDQKAVENYGNYGVDYDLEITLTDPWPGYRFMDTLYFDAVHAPQQDWYYSYFVGKLNGRTVKSPRWANKIERGWVLDKRLPGSYTLNTMVCGGSNHPLGLLFVSDN